MFYDRFRSMRLTWLINYSKKNAEKLYLSRQALQWVTLSLDERVNNHKYLRDWPCFRLIIRLHHRPTVVAPFDRVDLRPEEAAYGTPVLRYEVHRR